MSLFLCLQGNTYHYRKAVPASFRSLLGKTEIKKTLQTGNKVEAIRKSLIIGACVENALKQAESLIMIKTTSEEEVQDLLIEYFHYLLDLEAFNLNSQFSFSDLVRSKASQEVDETSYLDLSDWDSISKSLADQTQKQESKLDKQLSNRHLEAKAILDGLTQEHTSMTYKTVRSDLARHYPHIPLTGNILNRFSLASIDAHKLILERRSGHNSPIPEEYRQLPKVEDHSSVIFQPEVAQSVPLAQVIEEYTKDRLAIGRWKEKTKNENHALYNNFLEFAGKDIRCAEINYHLISEYRDVLKRLPANRNKSKQFRNKSISQLMKMDIPKPMSITTLNKNLNRLSTILKFAVKLGYMPTNPAEGMEIPVTEKDSEQRDIFNNSDLQKLFDSEQYHSDSFRHPFMFWTCPIALFTGMRQSEIAQLHLADIYEKDGIWIVDVNNNTKDKKVKTKNARRLIPLHSFLVNDLKLPSYVARLKKQGQKRLFPEISCGRDGYGQNVSRWFNGHGDGITTGYKKNCGITDGKKVFHSFRHTVIDHLKQKQVDGPLLHEFDGHSLGSMTYDRYGKPFNLKLMYEKVVSQITFDKELNLAHLLKSKHVFS